jgi:hypothetical protein
MASFASLRLWGENASSISLSREVPELDAVDIQLSPRPASRAEGTHSVNFIGSHPWNTTATMSSPTAPTMPTTSPADNTLQQRVAPEECITCRIIGTGALAGVGFYALQMSRPKAPGSIVGKRIMGGVGVCESLNQDALRARVSLFTLRSQVSFSPVSSDGTGGRSKLFVDILLTCYNRNHTSAMKILAFPVRYWTAVC